MVNCNLKKQIPRRKKVLCSQTFAKLVFAEMTLLPNLSRKNHKVTLKYVNVCLTFNLPLTSVSHFGKYLHTLYQIRASQQLHTGRSAACRIMAVS